VGRDGYPGADAGASRSAATRGDGDCLGTAGGGTGRAFRAAAGLAVLVVLAAAGLLGGPWLDDIDTASSALEDLEQIAAATPDRVVLDV
jgi:hypothetical protein